MIVGVPTRILPIEENLKTLKKIGFDGFQFDLSSCGIDTLKKCFLLGKEEDKCVEEIKKISIKLKFPVLALHTFYPLNSDENIVIKNFEKNLEYLKILKCKYLILHISGYCEEKERLTQAITCLKKIENLYKKSGCEILLENDHKPSLFITIKDIERINKKLNFNLCFDTTHAMQSNVNIDKFWKKFKNKIKAIHLSDFKDNKSHKEIGTGILKQFISYKEIINSNKLLILEVGKDFKRAKSKKEAIKVWENSFLEVSRSKKSMDNIKTLYITNRKDWRKWLEKNFDKEKDIWLIYPKKSSGKKRIIYNDAVEEALCFGWIDSTIKSLDSDSSIQRFSPRKLKSSYSQQNKERIKWLLEQNMIHPSILEKAKQIASEKFVFPKDIIDIIKKDKTAWKNYTAFSDRYKRIRIAYIDNAREHPEEFKKRLKNFIKKTRENKQIGFGGIEKYY